MRKSINEQKGFTLLIAIIITSMLVLVSFVVVNVALKQLILATAAVESQYAFYAAESGTECALYWDLPKDGSASAFSPPYNRQISCNAQSVTLTPGSNDGIYATTTFTINYAKGCSVVTVGKSITGSVVNIDSRGYNTCTAGALRKYERGVNLTYTY